MYRRMWRRARRLRTTCEPHPKRDERQHTVEDAADQLFLNVGGRRLVSGPSIVLEDAGHALPLVDDIGESRRDESLAGACFYGWSSIREEIAAPECRHNLSYGHGSGAEIVKAGWEFARRINLSWAQDCSGLRECGVWGNRLEAGFYLFGLLADCLEKECAAFDVDVGLGDLPDVRADLAAFHVERAALSKFGEETEADSDIVGETVRGLW